MSSEINNREHTAKDYEQVNFGFLQMIDFGTFFLNNLLVQNLIYISQFVS